MDLASDGVHRRFKTRLLGGLDPHEVELFIQQMVEDIQGLKAENAGLKRDIQDREKELREYREREKTIRNVLLSAQKTVDQMKVGAEKEARLIVAEAELKAEKILQGAHQSLSRLHEDIAELKRHRIQFETRLRNTIDTYRQILDMEAEENAEENLGSKVKYLAANSNRREQ